LEGSVIAFNVSSQASTLGKPKSYARVDALKERLIWHRRRRRRRKSELTIPERATAARLHGRSRRNKRRRGRRKGKKLRGGRGTSASRQGYAE
jgi:hypothetical protein